MNKTSIGIGLAITSVFIVLAMMIVNAEKSSALRDIERKKPRTMPTAWCVDQCRQAIFKDMHSSGESWGTSSSSMNGMAQANTLTVVVEYCENIYKSGCSEVNDYSSPYIHRGAFRTINKDSAQ